MNIKNYGTLSVSNNNLEQVLEIISNSGMLANSGPLKKEDIFSVYNTVDPVIIAISNVFGNIEGSLKDISDQCKKNRIMINGIFTHYGDKEKKFVFSNSELIACY